MPGEISLFANRMPGLMRLARLRNGRLEGLSLHRPDDPPAPGSIFKAKVVEVHAGIQAAYLDVGGAENVFLDRGNLPPGLLPSRKTTIESVLKPGREMPVQLRKPALGDKLARVDGEIKLAGLRLIHLPLGAGVSFSREFKGDRENLAERLPEQGGWIVRSAAAEVRPEVLDAEAKVLAARYRDLQQAAASGKPRLLYREDPVLAAVHEIGLSRLRNLHVDDETYGEELRTQLLATAPDLAARLSIHREASSLFDTYKIESQIDDLRAAKVWLKSGGRLHFHQTEAMVTIDVDSGKHGKSRGGLSAALRTNLEAADELAVQLRARNLAGLIVVDFINAKEPDWRTRVDNALKKALTADPARVELLRIDRFGLARLSRERRGPDLAHILTEPCNTCRGTGRRDRLETITADIQKQLLRESKGMTGETYTLSCGQSLADHLTKRKDLYFAPIETLQEIKIQIEKRHEMRPRAWTLTLG
ncbi:MAG: ribonuclease E/G [Acidobacteriota bacterium]|nr:ribonuclease E/G [Acidobacteriota bacterium]